MKTFFTSITFLLISQACFSQIFKGKSEVVSPMEEITISKSISKYNIVSLDAASIRKSFNQQKTENLQLNLELNGTNYNLKLQENELRTAECKQVLLSKGGSATEVTTSECHTYKGTVDGNNEYDVRLLISDKLFLGYINTATGRLYFEPIQRFLPNADKDDSRAIVFMGENLKSGIPEICNPVILPQTKIAPKPSGGRASAVPTSCRILELATDGDEEWFNTYGAQSWDQIQNIINQVESLYQTNFNMRIAITYMNMWTGGDPYNQSGITNGNAALDEFRNYWNSNSYLSTVKRDLVHMFTARNFSTPTAQLRGVHYFSVVCSNAANSYGISINGPYNVPNTTAHEIGHGFGGIHPNEDGDPEQTQCGTSNASVMCQGDKRTPPYFSTQQFNRLDTYIRNNQACLIDYSSFEIGGPNTLCNSATYSAYGPRNYPGRSWTSSSNIALNVDPNYTYTANATASSNGPGWIEASFNAGCAVTVRKNVNVSVSCRLAALEPELDNNNDDVMIYPNPANNHFNIKTNIDEKTVEILITNMSGGRVIKRSLSDNTKNSNIEIDLDQQPSGFYLLQLVTPTKVYTKKVMIER